MDAIVLGLTLAVSFTIGFFLGRVLYIKYHVNKPQDDPEKEQKGSTADCAFEEASNRSYHGGVAAVG